MPDPQFELADWLASPAGAAAIAQAAALPGGLPTVEALRATGLTPEQASASATQADLARRAAERFGVTERLLTRDGLEAATRPTVAQARAALLGRPRRIIDATAGLGFDTAAFVATGAEVIAIERDPVTARFLAANVPGIAVIVGDAIVALESLAPTPDDIVFLDPARRDGRRTADGSRAHPERDPERWSPPLSFAVSLAPRSRVCVKASPGFAPASVPAGWTAMWSSVQRTVVEACLFSWPALPAPRRALLVDTDRTLDGSGAAPVRVGAVGGWLHEPDPAIIAAGLLDDLVATDERWSRIDAHAPWLTSMDEVPSDLVRTWRIFATLPAGLRELRRDLQARGIGQVTVKTRGGRMDADAVQRRLKLSGDGAHAILVMTQAAGAPAAYLVEST